MKEENYMNDPLEMKLSKVLDDSGLQYTRPERDRNDPSNLDFYIPNLDLYIEVKAYHTQRIWNQVERTPDKSSILVLIGRRSVEAFRELVGKMRICAEDI